VTSSIFFALTAAYWGLQLVEDIEEAANEASRITRWVDFIVGGNNSKIIFIIPRSSPSCLLLSLSTLSSLLLAQLLLAAHLLGRFIHHPHHSLSDSRLLAGLILLAIGYSTALVLVPSVVRLQDRLDWAMLFVRGSLYNDELMDR
jgi:hypothetical protein